MRVAITGYLAHYTCGDFTSLWTPRLRKDWSPPEKAPLKRTYFDSSFGCTLLQSANLWYSGVDPDRLAVCFASSKGWPTLLMDWANGETSWPFCDGEAREIAVATKARGPVLCPVAACASSAHALGLGADLIETGRADVVLAGAAEPPQPHLILAADRNMGALSKSGIMRPFDARRDGFVPASGGALFVLESEAHARSRGAQIHGFLTGYSLFCDAHHMTSMRASGEGIARAIRDALRMANQPKIDYINAHGTATLNDAIESRAIQSVFGNTVPISSTKAQTGHLLGAAGAVEAAICLLAMKDNFAPPTMNLEEVDGELDYLPLVGREMKINAVLSLNYGFGGHIGALVLEKF